MLESVRLSFAKDLLEMSVSDLREIAIQHRTPQAAPEEPSRGSGEVTQGKAD